MLESLSCEVEVVFWLVPETNLAQEPAMVELPRLLLLSLNHEDLWVEEVSVMTH
jgi:hypothetical protein